MNPIRSTRLSLSLSQVEFSKRMGISRSTLIREEHAKEPSRVYVLAAQGLKTESEK
jgi:transcriptional regulator with XRE-family HTH domain